MAETKSTAAGDSDRGKGRRRWAAMEALTAALSAPSKGR